jgi:predicted AlkP superfamily pyrophosphatase or phosphodiesterase
LDRVGHAYGPDSAERYAEIRIVDAGVRDIVELAQSRFDEVHILVFGDHGMAFVNQLVDVQSILQKLPCRLGKDYLVFLDSTMARFWFFTDSARGVITEALHGISGGHVLSEEELNRYHLNYQHNRFGDLFFIADGGGLVLPNYYQKNRPIKGMHGYLPEVPEQHSLFLVHSPRVPVGYRFQEPQDMRRIFPTVLDLLDLPRPFHTRVESLLANQPDFEKASCRA